jgi:hypothetical protein
MKLIIHSFALAAFLIIFTLSSCEGVREAEWMFYGETLCEPWAEKRTDEYPHHAKEKLLKNYFRDQGVSIYKVLLHWRGDPGETRYCTACACAGKTVIELRVHQDDIPLLESCGFELGRNPYR